MANDLTNRKRHGYANYEELIALKKRLNTDSKHELNEVGLEQPIVRYRIDGSASSRYPNSRARHANKRANVQEHVRRVWEELHSIYTDWICQGHCC